MINRRFSGKSDGRSDHAADLSRITAKTWKEQLITYIKGCGGLPWVHQLRIMMFDSIDTERPGERDWFMKRLRELSQIERILTRKGMTEPPKEWKDAFEAYWRDLALIHAGTIANAGRDAIDRFQVHVTPESVLSQLTQQERARVHLTPIWEL